MAAGIYTITNTVNGKFYVGSAFDLDNRKSGHFSDLRKNRHRNPRLQNAFNKYGESVFVFAVIECCEKAECLRLEQYYLDTLRPFYNICKVAGNCAGKAASEETKEKQRRAKIGFRHTEQAKQKISEAGKGRVKKKETIEKFKKSLASRPQEVTDRWRANLSRRAASRTKEEIEKIARGRWKAVRQLTLAGEIIREWSCAKLASRELGIAPILISRCCRGLQKATKGFRWEFANK